MRRAQWLYDRQNRTDVTYSDYLNLNGLLCYLNTLESVLPLERFCKAYTRLIIFIYPESEFHKGVQHIPLSNLFVIVLTVGIGGGGFMTIFDKKSEQVEVIDFGGTTPSGMNDEDYNTNQPNKRYYIDERLSFGKDTIYTYVYWLCCLI